jgi:hypothetical protein
MIRLHKLYQYAYGLNNPRINLPAGWVVLAQHHKLVEDVALQVDKKQPDGVKCQKHMVKIMNGTEV